MICTDTIRIRLHGTSAEHPASVVEPLLVSDLPVFLRWRGVPPFGDSAFEELIEVADRLIVDSTEWPGLPAPYARAAEIFDRVAVSDIAWARTSRWRPMLASLWPQIATVVKWKRASPPQKAAGQLGECARINPDYSPAHYLLATVLEQQGKISESRREYRIYLGGETTPEDARRARKALANVNKALADKD